MLKFGIVGAGNMATAIARGIINRAILCPQEMMIFDIDSTKLTPFEKLGVHLGKSEAEIVEQCHFVLLAVKPQVYRTVLHAIAPICGGDTVFISIAAGISGEYLKKELGYDAKIVLVMPNTPLLVGCGASALSRVAPTSQQEFDEVKAIFAASGVAEEIGTHQMSEIIPVNGSSPALFYRIAQIFVARAAEQGIDSELANRLFCQTMIGSAKMMLETGKTHQELIDMVCSKGGTTLAMLDAMETRGLPDALIAGFDDCIRRAHELGAH